MTDYPVVVLGAGSEIDITRQELADYQFTVTNKDGSISSIALSEIATVEEGESLSSIRRDGQQRYLTVSASLIDGYNIGLVSQEIEDAIKDYELPRGYEIISSGENENINDALVEMVKMLLLAIAFIYLIMVAQFQSLLSPFIVMFTIPLAFTGGFVGLILTGNAVSVISMIGFVMLAGIIVNNGIVLVDYIIQLRLDGMNKRDALIEAGKTRMRPILMTALTTVLGLSTMALGIGMGADMVQPIAIVTIGGLLYATITTLFVIPVLYDIFNRKELKKILEEELKLYEEL
jgi:multidrug efflux pump subunit AcrB